MSCNFNKIFGVAVSQYNLNKSAKVGQECKCPTCKSIFIKKTYQQVFCKNNSGTICKDAYWNFVIPKKRNNTLRISPARKEWLKNNEIRN